MEASVESGRQVNQSIKREEGPVTAEVREVVPGHCSTTGCRGQKNVNGFVGEVADEAVQTPLSSSVPVKLL